MQVLEQVVAGPERIPTTSKRAQSQKNKESQANCCMELVTVDRRRICSGRTMKDKERGIRDKGATQVEGCEIESRTTEM